MEYRTIEEWCEILDSQRIPITSKDRIEGPYPYYGANGIQDYVNDYIFDDELVLLAEDGGNFGSKERPIAYRVSGKCWVNNHAHVLKPKSDLDVDYLCYSLMFYNTNGLVNGATRQKLTQSTMRKMKIPYLEINKQKEIVKKVKKIESILNDLNGQLDLLDELVKARFVEMFGDVQDAKKRGGKQLKNICNTVTGGTPSTKHVEYYNGTIPWISTVSLGPNYIDGTTAKAFITQEAVDSSSTKIIPSGSILFGTRVGVGKSSINQVEMCTNQDIVAIIDLDVSKYNKLYIKYVLDTYQPYFDSIKKGATILGISSDDLKNIYVPDASLYEQNRFEKFVKQIDKSRSRIQKSLEASQELFDSLMQEYFG
mgnify:CR=1 FL=1